MGALKASIFISWQKAPGLLCFFRLHALPSHVFSELDMPVGGLQTPSIIGRQGRKARVRKEDFAQERKAKTWIRQLEKARERERKSIPTSICGQEQEGLLINTENLALPLVNL
jgi:hypothetical protein